MSKFKRWLDDYIYDLSTKSRYNFFELMDIWRAYEREMYEAGEDVDFNYFTGVTLENDW